MNRTKFLVGKFGIVLSGVLLGCTTYGQPSASVEVSVPLPSVEVTVPSVEIRVESDFYEPLTPHGEWVVIGSYGRCWRPGHVARDWRPYCNGSWQRTEAGWYWVSDEPWAWATYHYGRWDFSDQYGWYWVPQTQWAPAWVSWQEGGGYVGWAPLQPSVRVSASGFVGFNASRISPRAFVFVEQREFLNPIRPTTVVVNNTTIINKTTTITNTKIVNNTVINEGPSTTIIEKASGRKVQPVQMRELRHKEEAKVANTQRTPTATSGKNVQPPVRAGAEPREKKAVPAVAPSQIEKPAVAAHEAAKSPSKNDSGPGEKQKPVAPASELNPESKIEGADHSKSNKQSAESKADKHGDRPEKPGKPSDKKVQRPVKEKPATSENNGAPPADKDHENKPKE